MPVDEEMGRMMCEMKILNDDWWVELYQIGAQRPRQKAHLIITSGIEDRTLDVKIFISYTTTRVIITCNIISKFNAIVQVIIPTFFLTSSIF